MIHSALDVIKRYSNAKDAKYIDIGCGSGSLGPKIREFGAQYCGVDPQAQGRDDLVVGCAEALPFLSATFNYALFINSLHHVPMPYMAEALKEAKRVLKNNGALIIIEPDIEGSLSQVLAVIDDESEVRGAAQETIMQMVEQGLYSVTARDKYVRHERLADFDEFCAWTGEVDESRLTVISKNRDAFFRAFQRHSTKERGNYVLVQPMNFVILENNENPIA